MSSSYPNCALALAAFSFLFTFSFANAGTITKTYTFTSGNTISSSQVNTDFDQLFTEINAKETRISTLESNSLHWDGSVPTTNAVTGRTSLGLGTAATLNAGTSANNVVQLDSNGKLPLGISSFVWESVAGALTVTNATWITVPGTTMTITLAGTATLEVHAVGDLTMTGSTPAYCAVRLILDGVGTGDATLGDLMVSPLASSYAPYNDLQMISNVSAGSHTIAIQLSMPAGGSATSCSHVGTPPLRMLVVAH